MTRVEFIDKDSNMIEDMYDCVDYPFEIGRTIHIEVRDKDPDFWKKEEFTKEYIVKDIKEFIKITYDKKGKDFQRRVNETRIISVELEEVKD